MTDTMRGISAMVAAMLGFAVGDTLVKLLGVSMPVGEMLFVRGLFSTAFVGVYALATGALVEWPRVMDRRVGIRTLADSACSVLFFLGLVRLSYADASAVGQFAPLMVMAGAALFLGEKVGWRRWTAASVGLVGVLLVIKPGTSAFQPASLLILASMLCIAVRDLITRRLPSDMPTVLVTLAAAASVTLVGALLAPFEIWRLPTPGDLATLAVCALAVLAGYVCIIIAMRSGNPAAVSPFRYSYMVFALVSSVLVFHQVPDALSLTGVSLVIGSGLYMLHRERIVGRRDVREGRERAEPA
jgi:drug/metabolite transporter (DMT)-like permease